MGALLSLVYGVVAYGVCLAALVYLIGFSGSVLVPKSVDVGAPARVASALCIDVLLIALFAAQHSVMARRSFKRWWTRVIPEHLERSTFCLAATAALALLLWQWRPIAEPVVWNVTNPTAALVLRHVFFLGWAVLFLATFLINHFELFGLHQVIARATGQKLPQPEFRTPLVYRYVRHPIYLGFVLAIWATPVMSAGHLLFAVATAGYILIGIWFEERDLIAQFGEKYLRYRRQVGMLVPGRRAP